MSRILMVVLTAVFALAPTACEREKPSTSSAPAPAVNAAAALPSGLFLSSAPSDAKDVKDAKPTLKAGDRVVLVGRIGGSEEPFLAERAIFTLVDRCLKACKEGNPEDKCATPWDYCCESRKDITANSATVQVVGADGQPLKAALNGVNGLKPLATVTVVGTIARAEAESVVISASGFYVVP